MAIVLRHPNPIDIGIGFRLSIISLHKNSAFDFKVFELRAYLAVI
jgi:hypothetical protein